MRKSDFLDEVRLQVGLAYDYAQDKNDFLFKVFKAIHKCVDKYCFITILAPDVHGECKTIYTFGKIEATKRQFGFGFVSLCNQQVSFLLAENEEQRILAPIFSSNRRLEYIISISTKNKSYRFTRQDIDFVNELIRFIEAKSENFIK
ncbi:hypothetical protein SAMN05421736_103287 [Evansella caseinilytica]|uniref:Uncharacterized protein n=1 Tax=Evansella caseinilytica TaxID=1503961 RepID=A0A1H3MNP6_9BACI|nr:hypothetical protein [Evansella caseinilytica]SDY78120.1 hypothetical protein SAMN05421736_103287 [Evansella caseinilytica]